MYCQDYLQKYPLCRKQYVHQPYSVVKWVSSRQIVVGFVEGIIRILSLKEEELQLIQPFKPHQNPFPVYPFLRINDTWLQQIMIKPFFFFLFNLLVIHSDFSKPIIPYPTQFGVHSMRKLFYVPPFKGKSQSGSEQILVF